jgi:hypothetical protein
MYALILCALYGVIYWLPTVVKGFGVTGTQNGLLSSVPLGGGSHRADDHPKKA